MKVLIIKVSALGDVIHALPVLAYLHSSCSAVEIDWLVEENCSTVLDGHPLLRQVIPLQTKRWRQLSFIAMSLEIWKFAKQLRRQRYDYVFDLQGNSKSGLFTLLSRGKNKYGFDRHHVREWPNLIATRHHVPLHENDHHIAQRSLAIVRSALPAGNDVCTAGPLHVTAIAREYIEQQLLQRKLLNCQLIVLNYGTTWQTKLWSLENWQQLAIKLVDNDIAVPLLTWGNDEELKAATAISTATAGRAIVWPRGSLPELVALLDRVDLVVGCDTGPIHIAAALGTPTVSLFRVTDATRNGPLGDKHRCLQTPLDCAGCLLKQCDRNQQCAASIAVADVYQAVIELTTTLGSEGNHAG